MLGDHSCGAHHSFVIAFMVAVSCWAAAQLQALLTRPRTEIRDKPPIHGESYGEDALA